MEVVKPVFPLRLMYDHFYLFECHPLILSTAKKRFLSRSSVLSSNSVIFEL